MGEDRVVLDVAGAGDRVVVAGAEDRAASEGCAEDGVTRRYSASQVVCVECWHVREMRGETSEVIRRTRSEEAELAVLNAVRACGVEPDWFVERWLEDEKVLVACAVFEDCGKCEGFRRGVSEWCAKLEARGDCVPVRLREDGALEAAVAEHFEREWVRMRTEQMGKYEMVMADAKERGEYLGRVLFGSYAAGDSADAKGAFERVRKAIEDANLKEGEDDVGIAYSGFWDEGNVARFAFGFEDAAKCASAAEMLKGIGADVGDPFVEDVKGVDLEMSALVIAKMRQDAAEREARRELAVSAEKAVDDGMRIVDHTDAEKVVS